MRDPYSLLGVKRSADVSEIKAAWRTKAKSIHPDHNQDDPGAGERFAEVGQAYELLKDPVRRSRYDRAADKQQTIMEQRENARQQAERARAAQANAERIMEELARANARRAQANASAGVNASAGASGAGAQAGARAETAGATGAAAGGADDVIERIFGSGPVPQAKPEEPAKTSESAPGADPAAASTASASANTASSAAAAAGTSPGSAGTSGANSDHVDSLDNKPLPVLAVDLIASLVRRIRGTTVAPEKAPDLSVDATVTIADLLQQNTVTVKLADEREVRVPLERGMTEGQVVRLKGQGLKVPQMKQGDLLVNLKLARDAQYRLDGYHIHTALSVSLEDAVLGTEVTLDTLDGSRQVVIPAWSGSDQTIRLEGLGLHTDDEARGDMIVELRILLWEKPDQKVTDLMRHMRHGLYL
jgi:DnaJ-class molecular chaperone